MPDAEPLDCGHVSTVQYGCLRTAPDGTGCDHTRCPDCRDLPHPCIGGQPVDTEGEHVG